MMRMGPCSRPLSPTSSTISIQENGARPDLFSREWGNFLNKDTPIASKNCDHPWTGLFGPVSGWDLSFQPGIWDAWWSKIAANHPFTNGTYIYSKRFLERPWITWDRVRSQSMAIWSSTRATPQLRRSDLMSPCLQLTLGERVRSCLVKRRWFWTPECAFTLKTGRPLNLLIFSRLNDGWKYRKWDNMQFPYER